MIINNHFCYRRMNTTAILNKEFSGQDFTEGQPYAEMLDRYRDLACSYARIENAIAVLSDLRAGSSYVYYGGFSRTLGIDKSGKEDELSSIWEDEIFRLIHPDDLSAKHLHELRFFHFMKRRPKRERTDYYLASKLRMKNATGDYVPVLHRMFYIQVPCGDSFWLAMCLYGTLPFDIPGQCVIINSVNGNITELDKQDSSRILSVRERQVLDLIDKGQTSKGIAETLSVSVHTVSRHRQEILGKLQVKNSIAACRVAKDLKLI